MSQGFCVPSITLSRKLCFSCTSGVKQSSLSLHLGFSTLHTMLPCEADLHLGEVNRALMLEILQVKLRCRSIATTY